MDIDRDRSSGRALADTNALPPDSLLDDIGRSAPPIASSVRTTPRPHRHHRSAESPYLLLILSFLPSAFLPGRLREAPNARTRKFVIIQPIRFDRLQHFE